MQSLSENLSLMWATINGMVQSLFEALPKLLIALVIMVAFWFVASLVRSAVTRATARRAHANVGIVLGRLAQWTLLFLGVLIAIAVVAPSVKPSNILQVLGVGSVAIGFAFKDVLQNFLAGILLLLREPFKIGDQIVFKGFEGTVDVIDTRSTRLKTYDGRRVVIPNGEIYTNAFIVNTAFGSRRSEYDVGIGYGDDLAATRAIMLEALKGVEGVLSDPAPDVVPIALAESSVNLRARWWTQTPRSDVVSVKGEVIAALKAALNAAQVDLPFPTRVVLFHDQTDANDGDRRRQREGWPAGEDALPPRDVPLAVEKAAVGEARPVDKA